MYLVYVIYACLGSSVLVFLSNYWLATIRQMHFVSPGWFTKLLVGYYQANAFCITWLICCSKSYADSNGLKFFGIPMLEIWRAPSSSPVRQRHPLFSSASCVLRPSLHRWLCGPLRASLASSTFSLHNVLCFADLYGRSSNWILQASELIKERKSLTFFSSCTTGNNFSIPRGKKMSTAFFPQTVTNKKTRKTPE
jgi:hypothetical protein